MALPHGPSDPQGGLTFRGGISAVCTTSQLVTRQSEDSRRATLLITSHRLYQHLLTITNAKQPANQLYCKYDLSSPSCIGSCRSACRGATQPCSVHPATSRPVHRHPPADRKPLVLKARTSHLWTGIWDRSVKMFHIFWSSHISVADKIY